MTQKVKKTVITLTVLHRADQSLDGMSLEDIVYETDEGSWLGHIERGEAVLVPDDQIATELQAMGNDGSFFLEEED